MPFVRIYLKKQIRLDRLNFRQQQMFKVGGVGVAAVKTRLAAAQGPTDSSAKPLNKRYAIWKTKQGKGNRRNLTLTGDMLQNFQVRTVSENKAKASNSTRKGRIKAWITNKIEPWIVFSPKNKNAVVDSLQREFQDSKKRLVVEQSLGGKQL
jgi:hypothetical protein